MSFCPRRHRRIERLGCEDVEERLEVGANFAGDRFGVVCRLEYLDMELG